MINDLMKLLKQDEELDLTQSVACRGLVMPRGIFTKCNLIRWI